MRHRATPDFWYHYRQLPRDVQELADRCYELLKQDPLALTIQRQIGTRPDEADTLSYLGQAQMQLGKYTEAQSTLQQSLTLTQEIGDRATEAQALSHLGQLFAKQNQPELAIVFYKQSVNTRETIRRGICTLSREQQESYTQTIADTYRALADLLLSQGRVLEAQQVLELLKVQSGGSSLPTLVTRLSLVVSDRFTFSVFAAAEYLPRFHQDLVSLATDDALWCSLHYHCQIV